MSAATKPVRRKTQVKKLFVLDTNVILHDSGCLHQFAEHDVAVPIIVLEELDKFKKGNESVNYHAREFLRQVDSLSGDRLFEDGVSLGRGQGKFMVHIPKGFHHDLSFHFDSGKPDHQILNSGYTLMKAAGKRPVILVTKDVNLRMKAKSIGLPAQDYFNDQVKDMDVVNDGRLIVEGMEHALIDRFYSSPFEVDVTDADFDFDPRPNQYLVLRNDNKSALARYDAATKKLKRVDKMPVYGIKPRNSEQTFALDALLNPDIPLVSITGKAGTGKTLLALAAALEKRRSYRQIYLARPVVPLSNKDIGYLPGDVKSKLDPYMAPLYDNLGVIQNQFPQSDPQYSKIKELIDEEKLKISPLAYIRGRSLVKVYFIIDEAQNLTPHEVKTIITRAGEGTKVVFTGDIYQIDHPYLDSQSNGLSYLIEKMQGQELYAHVSLLKGERSQLAELASNVL